VNKFSTTTKIGSNIEESNSDPGHSPGRVNNNNSHSHIMKT
jgi:hypothetical protein